MPHHAYFEELSTLAASGDLNTEEWKVLEQHLQNCESCRGVLAESQDVLILLSEAAELADPVSLPAGMRSRFEARARSEGIPIPFTSDSEASGSPTALKHRGVRYLGMAAMAASLAMSFYGGRLTARKDVPSRANTIQVVKPADNANAELLTTQLQDARNALAQSAQRLEKSKQELLSAQSARRELESQLAKSEQQSSEFKASVTEEQSHIKELDKQIQELTVKESADHLSANVSEQELASLRAQQVKLTAELNDARHLQSVLLEAQDLITDRNLHVLDIRSAQGKRGPSGKIFYTEGRRLQFYAYDLSDPRKIDPKTSFYAWGETAGDVQTIVSLGKFQVDSAKEGRWVLRVKEPERLPQLVSVFVTEEPGKGEVKQPTGHKMLSRTLPGKDAGP